MQKNGVILFGLLLLIYLIGMGIDIMDIDAAQYASMSREMLRNGSFLQVYDHGQNYLDKPPFLFWVSALSMKIFGANNFSYRFPSFLFALLALYSTFRFARLYYQKEIAVLSSIILASCQAFFLINHDVRTDTILMGWVILSIWQLAEWYQNKRLLHFIIGCVAIAGGMMTKGPIALFVPIFAFGTHYFLQRNFSYFFKWQYLLGILIIAFLLIPMSIGLYHQFDLHPEKLVNGKTDVSGLRFFFWTQSFGRITGESSWNNQAGIFFLLQNMMWAFLPWIIFFLIGLYVNIKQIIITKFSLTKKQEAITTGGFILTYLSLGMSKYQLPHYIFVVFPLAAIITAVFLYQLIYENKYPALLKGLLNFHLGLSVLLFSALFLLITFPFKTIPAYASIAVLFFLAGLLMLFIKKRKSPALIVLICLYTIMTINFFLNAYFYPALLAYQAGSSVGKWMKTNNINTEKTYFYQYDLMRSLDFYANGIVLRKDSLNDIKQNDYILTEETKLKDFDKSFKHFDILFKGIDYPVTRLKMNFILPQKREKELTRFVLIKMK